MFPDPWQISRVSPIHKTGEKVDKSNYHPYISLTCRFNPIRPRVFDALGSIGGGADSAPLIYFCSVWTT